MDLRKAILHFDAISSNLGKRFREEVRVKLGLIAHNPELYACINGAIRAARLRRFPFVVLYTIEEDCVYFVSLVPGSSDRGSWFDRLG
jgi:hypothetical protein